MNSYRPVKVSIWIYFALLLLEGALRKWAFPRWSDLLFIVRDPVVLVIYALAWRAGCLPRRPAIVVLAAFVVLSIAFSLGAAPRVVVTLFGLRTNYLHLPLVFIIGDILDRNDVVRFGRWFLCCALPIVGLMIVQFNSPPHAWINAGVGGAESGQLLGALGRIRPPGPFSFISGAVAFFGLVTAFVIYGWLRRGVYPTWLLLAATAAIAIAIPVSISRSLMLAVLVVVVFGAAAALRDVRRLFYFVAPLAVVIGALALTSDSVYMQVARYRWDTAAGGDFSTNVVGRILGEFTEPFALAAGMPLWGHGIGLGTVAGARLMTGERAFLLAESELARIVMELGPILGFAFIGWRAWLAMKLLTTGGRDLLRNGEPLAWLVCGASFAPVLNGQWGPATQLGFAVFGAGLALAAANEPPDGDSETDEDGDDQQAADRRESAPLA